MIIDASHGSPLIKPAMWGIDPGIVAYNASRMGLPMPGVFTVWNGGNLWINSGKWNGDGDISGAEWIGSSLDFDSYASSDIVNLPDDDKFRFVFSQGTLFCRVYARTIVSYPSIFTVRDGGSLVSSWYFNADTSKSMNFYMQGANFPAVNGIAQENQWATYAITWDGTNIKFYVNGLLTDTVASNKSPQTSAIIPAIGNRQTGGRCLNGLMEIFAGVDSALTSSQVATLSADPYGLVRQPSMEELWAYVEAGYILPADGGSYGVTGQAIELLADRKLPTEAGSYNLTGTIAELLRGYPLTAEAGAYTIIGQDVGLKKDSKVSIDSGSYGITGQDAALLRDLLIAIESGTYGLTGSDVTLIYTPVGAYTLIAGSGTYDLTGSALDLLRGYHLGIEAGAYALSGENVSVLKDSKLTAQPGAYNISGQAVALLRDYLVSAEQGNYDISGQDIAFLRGFVIGLETGGYNLSGQDVELTHGKITIGCMTITFDSKQPSVIFDSKQPSVIFDSKQPSITFEDWCD